MNPLRFFRRRRHDVDLAREIDAHIEAERAEYIARGLNHEEANRRARIKFGSERRVHEDLWRQNSFAPFENITRDLCYTLRTLASTPSFTVTAIFMMALGIGATTALFTVVRSVLLNPLPYPQSQHYHYIPVTAGSFAQWKRAAQSSAEIAIVCPWMTYDVSANGTQLPESVHAGWVSWNFFRVLGVAPALGRAFLASDDQPSAAATTILSNAFWKRRFGADPNIIGKSVYLDAKPYTVIGVMPPSFIFPDPKTQLWTAASHEGSHALMTTFEDHRFWAIARLAHRATLSSLLSQLDIVQTQIKLSRSEAHV